MATPTTTAEVNRSLASKTVEKFYISFLQMPENLSNILGREVKSVSRPNITFNEFEIRHKGKKQTNSAFLEYQPVDVVFYDDTASLVTRSLYEQIKRQTGEASPNFFAAKFEMKVNVYSIDDALVETFTIKDAHITSILHTELIINDSSNNAITVSVTFNELDYEFPVLEDL